MTLHFCHYHNIVNCQLSMVKNLFFFKNKQSFWRMLNIQLYWINPINSIFGINIYELLSNFFFVPNIASLFSWKHCLKSHCGHFKALLNCFRLGRAHLTFISLRFQCSASSIQLFNRRGCSENLKAFYSMITLYLAWLRVFACISMYFNYWHNF